MNLILVQTETTPDKSQNLKRATAILRDLPAGSEPSLVVFPEMYMALPTKDLPLHEHAEALDGPFVTGLARAAAESRVHVACGVWEESPEPQRVYNTLVVLGPDGRLAASYRKLHLFDALSVRESDRMVAGAELPPVISIGGVRTGFAICYDLRFPELFRDLAARDAELVVLPSAWYAGPFKEDHWSTLLRARAIENTMFVAGANLTTPVFCGRSAVYDPFGVPVAAAGEGAGFVNVTIDPARVLEVREKLPSLRHRRRGLYSERQDALPSS